AQTDKKAQVIWSVAISAWLAALGAHSLVPSRPSAWFWTTPLIVGVIGYLLAWMGGNQLPGGEVGGLLPALARPLPVDYASAGVWARRRYPAAFISKLVEALGEAMETQSWLDHATTCDYCSRDQYRTLDAAWQSIGGSLQKMIDRAPDFCRVARR